MVLNLTNVSERPDSTREPVRTEGTLYIRGRGPRQMFLKRGDSKAEKVGGTLKKVASILTSEAKAFIATYRRSARFRTKEGTARGLKSAHPQNWRRKKRDPEWGESFSEKIFELKLTQILANTEAPEAFDWLLLFQDTAGFLRRL